MPTPLNYEPPENKPFAFTKAQNRAAVFMTVAIVIMMLAMAWFADD